MIAAILIGAALTAVILAIAGKQSAASSGVINVPDTGTQPDMPPVQSIVKGDHTGVTNDLNMEITTDRQTWPSGDRVWDICQAIAIAEGYDTNGAAFKLNNPGDISDYAAEYGSEYHDGSNITHFPNAQTGWDMLYKKIDNHVSGKSSTYPRSMTIDAFSKKYAGNSQIWAANVCRVLNVSSASTFADYVNS